MVIEIVFTGSQWAGLENHLFSAAKPWSASDCDEQMALLLAGPSASPKGTRLVVRELLFARQGDLAQQSAVGIAPTGEFVAAALTRCRQEGWSLIEVHSHPFSDGPSTTFSSIDWANDQAKMPTLAKLLPEDAIHATMVVGQASLDAHYYDRESGTIRPVRRVSIHGVRDGAPLVTWVSPVHAEPDDEPFPDEARYIRQIPLLGRGAQSVMAQSVVVIVGLGGLGSFAAVECAHLGIGTLILIDPDRVEASNLNRLVAATDADVGRAKVDVYAALVHSISPRTSVMAVTASILSHDALQAAKQADLLLGCVDSHGARLVMNQFAVQYGIPLLDAGTGARIEDGQHMTHAGGQVQLVLPGLGCLVLQPQSETGCGVAA